MPREWSLKKPVQPKPPPLRFCSGAPGYGGGGGQGLSRSLGTRSPQAGGYGMPGTEEELELQSPGEAAEQEFLDDGGASIQPGSSATSRPGSWAQSRSAGVL